MTAYYNEIDPYAAQWLRNLIAAGHIAPGDVDERSIEDVHPDDLRPYRQCHFFAGIGVWSYALRLAGWPDDRRVWTGSCPCQPFSAAGKGGGFADERHLWPAWFHLITHCRPQRIRGEQVASRDGLAWLDLVLADLEGADYSAGAVDLCAAGVGAPHIRQRLWLVADADGQRHEGAAARPGAGRWDGAPKRRSAHGLAYPHGGHASAERQQPGGQHGQQPAHGGALRVGDADGAGIRWEPRAGDCAQASGGHRQHVDHACAAGDASDQRPGPANGMWRAADWLACRDGKWRPVEPGTFPLAHGAAGRVGRLRAYGNAINAEAAAAFLRAAA